ncbi:hypothetical protein [Limosilactobacillus oris]|uniref:hypothetical protein n=1 Tax=Limosilactobacillus oris TaxID=1632 RepID=UPI0026591F87|nr:hypothetical protein [Limosilactobacillus oris]
MAEDIKDKIVELDKQVRKKLGEIQKIAVDSTKELSERYKEVDELRQEISDLILGKEGE